MAQKQTDIDYLKRKVDAGANIIITQLFFDNQHYFRFVETAQNAGITIPIIPGLMPVQSHKQILRITSMCGATIPNDLQKKLAAADEADVPNIGAEHCATQATELIAKGAPGIHFYVLNKSMQIVYIMSKL